MNRNRNNNSAEPNNPGTNREVKSTRANDLPDSPRDREKLEPEETTIDLPDVKDISGQEFVNAPPAGMMGDTTISSDDEEGRNVFDQDETEDLREGNEADVSSQEKETLERHSKTVR